MDPPTRPLTSRRSASTNLENSHNTHLIRDASPSPAPTNPPAAYSGNMGTRAGTRLASRRWDEEETETVTHDDLEVEIELAECVETRTVTTTTTTKRSYPPILVRQTRPLQSLDAKEYPLAQKPTPADLAQFSYVVEGGKTVYFREGGTPQKNQTPDVSFSNASRELVLAADVQESKSPKLHVDTSPDRIPSTSYKKKPSPTALQKQSGHSSANPPRLRSGISLPSRSEILERSRFRGHLPATPETSELNTPVQNVPTQDWPSFQSLASQISQEIPDQNISPADESSWTEAPSPPADELGDSLNTAVATPPTAESDLEAFDGSEIPSTRSSGRPRRLLDTTADSNASLPSPRLSPTLAAAQLHSERHGSNEEEEAQMMDTSIMEHSQDVMLRGGSQRSESLRPSNLLGATAMIETFDTMSDEMQTYMMYQFLKRCTRKTLHTIASVVNPALKCDFLDRLPLELSYNILSFLTYKDLCRAAQVSKRWRHIIDGNETGWKALMDNDGVNVPSGELQRAIAEGWGWQDPGPEGCEKDISGRTEENNPSGLSNRAYYAGDSPPHISLRTSSKRKRSYALSGERSKRRSLSSRSKTTEARKQEATLTDAEKVHKSEGPLSAANAAALAVPNPDVGLPSLRELHLFKSLYRRYYMMQRNWTNREVKPLHMAFAAHPRFVITCLQFDDDKIITGSDDTFIHVYDTKTGALRKKLEGHEGGVWALQYEGNVLVSGSTDRSVRVWDIEKGLCTQIFNGHTSTVRCLQILMPTPTGIIRQGKEVMMPEVPLIITGSRDSQLRVWKLPTQGAKRYLPGLGASDGDCPYFVRLLAGHHHSVRAIAAHGDTLVSGSYDNTVRVWRISDGEVLHRLIGHTNKVYSVVLDKGRNRCISGSMDNHVKIWSLETGACLYTLEGHTSLVGLLDLYDNRLVSAAADSTLRIWDPENGQCKHTLTAHTAAITCFQHDDTKVISGSDRTLKMWNVKTGECMQDLLTDLSGVWQVRFDQRRCVAAVQRNGLTYIEVLDFGAIRDGVPSSRRGCRIVVEPNGRNSNLGREEIASASDPITLDD